MKRLIKTFGLSLFAITGFNSIHSQVLPNETRETKMNINGEIVRVLIVDGESLPTICTAEVRVLAKKYFKNSEDSKTYRKIKYNASVIRPYAIEAISLYREVLEDVSSMKKKDAKKHTRKVQREYTSKYKDKLKNLSKDQGIILIKMIERELETPFYTVITQLRGGWEATKWQTISAFFGYNLKKGYNTKADKITEMVLSEYDLSYDENFKEL